MTLPEKIADWPEEWKQLAKHRSVVLRVEGGLSFSRAEREAEADVRRIAEREVCPT